eukprot:5819085-Pyramimonas_sp.AAC.1
MPPFLALPRDQCSDIIVSPIFSVAMRGSEHKYTSSCPSLRYREESRSEKYGLLASLNCHVASIA